MTDQPNQKFKLWYRQLLFAFLGDETLDKAQRAIGTVLILKADARRKFVAPYYPLNFEKLALLSGYSEKKCQEVCKSLFDNGWLQTRTRKTDGATTYQISEERYAAAVERQQAHNERIKEARVERKASSAEARLTA